jgi:hypothetical protein
LRTDTVYAQIWIKPNGEMPFLYGNHIVKAHLGRITEDTPEHQGVVVFSMNDIPLVRITRFYPSYSLFSLAWFSLPPVSLELVDHHFFLLYRASICVHFFLMF